MDGAAEGEKSRSSAGSAGGTQFTTCFTGTKVQILTLETRARRERAAAAAAAAAAAEQHTAAGERYTVYLLYWHNSRNSDAAACKDATRGLISPAVAVVRLSTAAVR